MNMQWSVRTTHNLLVPAWIAAFGITALNAPPFGVAASLSLFVAGVVVVPVLLMIPAPAKLLRAMANRPAVSARRYSLAVWRAALRG